MKRATLICTLVIAALGALLVYPSTAQAQSQPFPPPPTPCAPAAPPSIQPPTSIYNPYPPGILPSDIDAEIARVRCEAAFIESQAIGQWNVLGPLAFQGNPPILQGNGKAAVQILGKLMNFDENISVFKNVACAFCHMPYVGFSGPIRPSMRV